MSNALERHYFSERLKKSLLNAHYLPNSPTKLAREFNIRFSGKPVTVHAARKWLMGEAIPTQEKIRALANWLGVSVEWLRFDGEFGAENTPVNNVQTSPEQNTSEDLQLISDLHRLDAIPRAIVREMVRVLLRIYHPS